MSTELYHQGLRALSGSTSSLTTPPNFSRPRPRTASSSQGSDTPHIRFASRPEIPRRTSSRGVLDDRPLPDEPSFDLDSPSSSSTKTGISYPPRALSNRHYHQPQQVAPLQTYQPSAPVRRRPLSAIYTSPSAPPDVRLPPSTSSTTSSSSTAFFSRPPETRQPTRHVRRNSTALEAQRRRQNLDPPKSILKTPTMTTPTTTTTAATRQPEPAAEESRPGTGVTAHRHRRLSSLSSHYSWLSARETPDDSSSSNNSQRSASGSSTSSGGGAGSTSTASTTASSASATSRENHLAESRRIKSNSATSDMGGPGPATLASRTARIRGYHSHDSTANVIPDPRSSDIPPFVASTYDPSELGAAKIARLRRKGVNPALYAEMKAARKGKGCVSALTGNAYVS